MSAGPPNASQPRIVRNLTVLHRRTFADPPLPCPHAPLTPSLAALTDLVEGRGPCHMRDADIPDAGPDKSKLGKIQSADKEILEDSESQHVMALNESLSHLHFSEKVSLFQCKGFPLSIPKVSLFQCHEWRDQRPGSIAETRSRDRDLLFSTVFRNSVMMLCREI